MLDLGFLAGQALMEVLPLWMLVTLMQHNAGLLHDVSFVFCWSLQLAAASAAWAVLRMRLAGAPTVLLLSAAGLGLFAAAQLAVPSEPVTWLLSGCLCVRGLFMGLRAGKPGVVLRWFGLGSGFCVLLFAFIALSGTPRDTLPYDQLRWLSIVYLFAGALLAGLDQCRTSLTAAALFSVLAPTFLLSAGSAVLVLGPHSGGSLVRAGSETIDLVKRALVLLGSWLVGFLHWLGSLFEPPSGSSATPAASGGEHEATHALVRFREITWRMSSAETLAVLLLLLGVVIAVLIVASLARGRVRTLSTNDELHIEEEQLSTWSWQLLLQPLERLRRKREPGTMPPLVAAEPSALRAIYRKLLAWAAQRGQQRHPSATPLEFAAQLSLELPAQRQALSELTDYYTKERYAERVCTSVEQEHARELLHVLTRPDD